MTRTRTGERCKPARRTALTRSMHVTREATPNGGNALKGSLHQRAQEARLDTRASQARAVLNHVRNRHARPPGEPRLGKHLRPPQASSPGCQSCLHQDGLEEELRSSSRWLCSHTPDSWSRCGGRRSPSLPCTATLHPSARAVSRSCLSISAQNWLYTLRKSTQSIIRQKL